MKRSIVLAALAALLLATTAHAQEEPPTDADLAVTKSGPTQAAAGSNVPYDITVVNNGPLVASTVVLTDVVPDGMTFVSATQQNGPAFNCTELPAAGSGGTIRCEASNFAVGQPVTFTFVFNIPAGTPGGTQFTNIATVSGQTPDAFTENNSAAAGTAVPAPPVHDVGVQKGGPSIAGPDTNVVYTLVVSHASTAPSDPVTFTDTLPGTMTFVSITQTGAPFACTTPATGAGGTITCTSASMPANASTTFTLTGHIPAGTASGTQFVNTAVVATANDQNEENNTATTTTAVSNANVAVTKNGPATGVSGANLTYAINLTNGGPDVARDVDLTDVIPAGTTFVSFTRTAGVAPFCATPPVGGTGTIVCTYDMIPNGGSSAFTLVVRVGNTTSVTNTATATTTGTFDPDTSNNSQTTTAAITFSSDLSVTKTAPATATAGTNVTYTISAANGGPSDASNVSVADELPANTTFVSVTQNSGPTFNCTTPAVGANGTVTCTIATFAAGSAASFTVVARIAPSAAAGSVLTNRATIATTTPDPAPANNTATAPTAVTTSADLAVTKTGPASANAGANITYTIGVTNNGPSDAVNVSLTDATPAGTTFVSLTQTAGPTFTCTPPAGSPPAFNCTIATFASGATATFTYVVNVSSATPNGRVITNTAAVSSPTSDPAGANNTATTNATTGVSADVAVAKSGPLSAAAGTNATYTITATNNGPSDASNVSLTDATPANTTFVSMTQTGGPTFTCTPPAGTPPAVNCTIATFVSGATATFTYVVSVSPAATNGTQLTNVATIASTTTDPNGANNTATATAIVGAAADLAITKNAPATGTGGSNITYTIAAVNNGPATAMNVTLTDALPAAATFVSLAQDSGPTFNCTTPAAGATGTVTCTLAAFAPSASASFRLVVNATPGTSSSLNNTATITSATPDPLPANNTSSTAVPLNNVADLSITKTTGGGPFLTGGMATFNIAVINNGPAVAAGTTVTDVLPAGTTFVSATPSQGACSGTTTVVCTLGNLAANASATITLTVRLPDVPTQVSNTATVSATNADSNPANNASTATFLLENAVAVPALSPLALALLSIALAAAGWMMQKMR
jgi:uncharacterized repeat protein (TIGR01451 family)